MVDRPDIGSAHPTPESAFTAFSSFVTQFDPIELLSQLTLTFLFTQESDFIGESHPARLWARWIEFTAGYLATIPERPEYVRQFDGSCMERFETLIKQYFDSFFFQFLQERPANPTRTAADLVLIHAKNYSMYVRGDAYPHQFRSFALDLYGQHDQWFLSKLGFTIHDATRIFDSVAAELERRVNESASNARREAPAQADEVMRQGGAPELSRQELVSRIAIHLHYGAARELLRFTEEQLALISGVEMARCAALLRRMSQPFGYHNPAFPNTFSDPAKAPWDYNCVEERPFLRSGDSYWIFTNSMLRSVLFHTFYFDLMADDSYRPRFEKSRGTFVEAKVREYAARVFPEGSVLLNPMYPNGEEFSDVAVLHDGKVLVFQCKAKGLTRSARIGEDISRLRADMHSAIRSAFDQAVRARKHIRSSAKPILRTKNIEWHIDASAITDIYLVNVTLMPFLAMTTRFENIEEALGLFPEREYPLSFSLGDLDILTQVLDSPARFLHYVNRRLTIEKTLFNVDADELDLLAYYLDRGLYFKSEDFANMTHVSFTGYSDEIDEFVHRRHDLHEDVNPPKTPMPAGFSELIACVESLSSMYRTDCAIALLDMSGPARSKLMEVIEATKTATRLDQKEHSVSMGGSEESRGWSFRSVVGREPKETAYKAAFSFATLKKYSEKADEWFGFGWHVGSQEPVDAAVMLKFPWEKDDLMEEAIKKYLKPGRRIDLTDAQSSEEP
jgi:hypothetical protein